MDVFVPTRNSARYLNACLTGIKNTIGKNITIVDHQSTDATLEIARKHSAKILTETGGLAEAMQICCDNAESEFFAIVDSDVELIFGAWLCALEDLMCQPAVGGVGLRMQSNLPKWREQYNRYWLRVPDSQALMGGKWVNAYIIRKDAIEGIRMPRKLKSYNHVYLKDYILSMGYVLASVETNCMHHYDYQREKCEWLGAGLRVYYGVSKEALYYIGTKVFPSPLKAVPPAIACGDPSIIAGNTRHWLSWLRGFLHPERYVELNRES